MRLFLDANILFLVGYSSKSPVHDLFALAGAGHCVLMSSQYALQEARRNLELKAPDRHQQPFMAAASQLVVVAEAGGLALRQAQAARLADPSDIPILAAAMQCAADGLASGDRRAFGPFFGRRIGDIRVLRLRDALTEILASASGAVR